MIAHWKQLPNSDLIDEKTAVFQFHLCSEIGLLLTLPDKDKRFPVADSLGTSKPGSRKR